MLSKDTVTCLSDSALLRELEKLSRQENETTVHVLLHLCEVEKRKLYVDAGYSTMFTYCTEKLHYSEPAASRRLCCARATRRFPEVLELLINRELSLTTLSLVSGVLNEDNHEEVIAGIRGKSRREVEELLAGYRPREKGVRERIKPVVVRVKRKEEPMGALFCAVAEKAQAVVTCAGGRTEKTDRESGRIGAAGEDEGVERYEIRFSISREELKQVEEAKSLLWGKYPEGVKLEHVFGEALEAFLEKRSPKRRKARREKRVERVRRVSKPKKRSRYVPAAVRDKVFVRDGGRCTFVSADGVRCAATRDLEIHHVCAYGRGGGHEAENLTLLCRKHNVYEAECEFGREHIQKYVDASWENRYLTSAGGNQRE